MPVRDRIGRTRLDTIAAENAAVVIDVVYLGITFCAANPMLGSILGCLNVDAVRRARRGTQETGDAFFEAILVALQYVYAAIALLQFSPLQRPGAIGIVFNLGGLKHLPEGNAHPFRDRRNVLQNGHVLLVYRKRQIDVLQHTHLPGQHQFGERKRILPGQGPTANCHLIRDYSAAGFNGSRVACVFQGV